MERDLKTGAISGSGGKAAGDAPPTPTRKLGKAIGDENERFLSGQSQQQQQIIRCRGRARACAVNMRWAALLALVLRLCGSARVYACGRAGGGYDHVHCGLRSCRPCPPSMARGPA